MADLTSDEETMTEIFLSDEPWATARTAMLRLPRAASIRPVVCLLASMSLPTRQTMEYPVSTLSGFSFPSEISYAKHLSAASFALSASLADTATHIVLTEDA